MQETTNKKSFSAMQVLGIVALAMTITVVATVFIARAYLFPQPFTPVTLSETETQTLEHKLALFENISPATANASTGSSTDSDTPAKQEDDLTPEPYTEEGASREIHFSERELNGLLAQNTDMAQKLAIDLAQDLVSAKMIIPIDPDFPVFGGKTLKVRAGAELAYRQDRPVVKLRGISIMGVPVPNAWLGGMKNIDLVKEFGADEGFWKAFADGVESIKIQEGSLQLILKE